MRDINHIYYYYYNYYYYFAGASFNFSSRHANYLHEAKQRSLLPHVFYLQNMCSNISKNSFEVGHKSSKRFTLYLEFRTRH